MKEFYELNRKKFIFIFRLMFLFAFIILLVAFLLTTAQKPAFNVVFFIECFLSALGFSLLMVLIIFANGYYPFVRQRKFFGQESLTLFLLKYNFHTELTGITNRWSLLREIKTGIIRSYKISLFWHNAVPKNLHLVIELAWPPGGSENEEKLKELFLKQGFQLTPGAVIIETNDFNNLESRIFILIDLLQNNNLKPWNYVSQ